MLLCVYGNISSRTKEYSKATWPQNEMRNPKHGAQPEGQGGNDSSKWPQGHPQQSLGHVGSGVSGSKNRESAENSHLLCGFKPHLSMANCCCDLSSEREEMFTLTKVGFAFGCEYTEFHIYIYICISKDTQEQAHTHTSHSYTQAHLLAPCASLGRRSRCVFPSGCWRPTRMPSGTWPGPQTNCFTRSM